MKNKKILVGCLGLMLGIAGMAQTEKKFSKRAETLVGPDG